MTIGGGERGNRGREIATRLLRATDEEKTLLLPQLGCHGQLPGVHWNWTIALSEWEKAGRLWQGIAGLSYCEQLRAVSEDRELWTWGVCRLLQRFSLGEGGQSGLAGRNDDAGGDGDAGGGGHGWVEAKPVTAGRLANLARQVARRLSDAYDPVWVRGLQAVCLASLGNARRADGEMEAAADAFAAAREAVGAGVGSAAFEAEAMALEALLERDRWRLEEAVALCRRALAVYRRLTVAMAIIRQLAGLVERSQRPSLAWWSGWATGLSGKEGAGTG